jgi:glutamate synthase (NADPH) large chain
VHKLQQACRHNITSVFKEYSALVNDQLAAAATPCAGCWSSSRVDRCRSRKWNRRDIMRRFKTGAMSYGSISKEAHETLAIAMNRIGGKSNTGEGGEDPGALRAWTRMATRATARSSRSPPDGSA